MKDFNDIDALHSQVVFLKMREKTTEELVSIWSENNQKALNKDEFAAVQKILLDRLGKLPEQKEIKDANPDKTSLFNFSFNDKLSIAIILFCLVFYFIITIGVKLISIIILLAPLSIAIIIYRYMRRCSLPWIEAYALILSLLFLSYGILFWLITKDIFSFQIAGMSSVVSFLAISLWPITSPKVYQAFHFKSILFDGQSGVSKVARYIKKSRSFSLLTVLLFFIGILAFIYYSLSIYK